MCRKLWVSVCRRHHCPLGVSKASFAVWHVPCLQMPLLPSALIDLLVASELPLLGIYVFVKTLSASS